MGTMKKLSMMPDGTLNEEFIAKLNLEASATQEEVTAEVIRLIAEYDAQAYARNRVDSYPSNGDQWDMIYKDNKNSTTTHADAVEAVKTKWPKNNTGPVE